MIIYHRKRKRITSLFLAIVWFALFIVGILVKDETNWTFYAFGLLALAYFGLFAYQGRYPYLHIKKGRLTQNGPLGKEINLTDIRRIQKSIGEYRIFTHKKIITINTDVIDDEAKAELNAMLTADHSHQT
jgi:hypothetical protein